MPILRLNRANKPKLFFLPATIFIYCMKYVVQHFEHGMGCVKRHHYNNYHCAPKNTIRCHHPILQHRTLAFLTAAQILPAPLYLSRRLCISLYGPHGASQLLLVLFKFIKHAIYQRSARIRDLISEYIRQF